jgi:hypothetical protein
VTANVIVSTSGGDGIVQCDAVLRQRTTSITAGSGRAAVGTAAGDIRYTTLTAVFGGTLATAGTVRVSCWQVSPSTVTPQVRYADVTAVRVGSITQTATLG